MDIAPQHASVIMGISNTFATIPGIISPTLTGFIVLNSVRKIYIEVLKDIFINYPNFIISHRLRRNGKSFS